jgi:hypothetical protein
MKKRKWKKIAIWSISVFVGLVVILAAHIWWVTHPRIDANTRIMARIDLHQRIGRADADKITGWLYQQKGVKYVLVNPASEIAVFSYAPIDNDGNRIVAGFREQSGFVHAARYLPVIDPNASGCPVAATSFSYKVYSFMKRVL